jgi:hypothetical protein
MSIWQDFLGALVPRVCLANESLFAISMGTQTLLKWTDVFF